MSTLVDTNPPSLLPPGQIYQLLPKVAAAIGVVGKDRQANMGAGGSFAFRGIDDLITAAHQALCDHGITVLPRVRKHRLIERERIKDGRVVGMTIHVVMTVDYSFSAPDGSMVTVRTVGEAADTGDKATSKAASQSLKYALMHVFTVPTSDVAQADKAKAPEMGARQTSGKPAPAGYDRPRRNAYLMKLYNDIGYARPARLAHASGIIGRDLASFNDLTDDELEAVIKALVVEHAATIINGGTP